MTLEELGLYERTIKILNANGITTVNQLTALTLGELRRLPRMGARVCFQKHKSKKKLKKYAVSLLKPKGKQVVDVEYNL